jgi:hypothetical protein
MAALLQEVIILVAGCFKKPCCSAIPRVPASLARPKIKSTREGRRERREHTSAFQWPIWKLHKSLLLASYRQDSAMWDDS